MKKYLSLILLLSIMVSLLSGCGVGSSALKDEIASIPPMTVEEVAGRRLVASTNQEVESEIYQYVTDRIVVDGSKLITVSGKDESNIRTLLANINTQLSGKGGTALTDEYANYLLLEFAKTPYEWSQSNMDIIGFDPAARLYFVDVTYATTKTYKSVVPDSKIANGDPDNYRLKQKRYMDYMTMLNYKYPNTDNYGFAVSENESERQYQNYIKAYNLFVDRWGEVDDVFNEQQGVSLYERTLDKGTETGGIGKLTYSGLVSNENLSVGATMTVRYVLKYSLNLGEETDLAVEALYVKSFELNNYESLLNKYTLSDAASLEVLKPFIDQLILSYNKCVEESNHIGLYQLFEDYSTTDKYYDEIRDYTYNSIGAYNYRILARENSGRELVVRVDQVNQIRARGAEMSLPTYDETLIFTVVLCPDDAIRIKNVNLVSRTMIGEPLSVIKNVTGISDQIQYADVAFSDNNKQLVEQLIKDFSQVVANSDYSSEAFVRCVDLGISQNTLNRMADTIKSIVPNRKLTYIISWDTKTNVYCSVTVREVFECEKGSYDTEAVIDMGNRNGVWKVVNYTRTVNIKTGEDVALDESTAFCVNTRGNKDVQTTVVEDVKDRNTVEAVTPVESEAKPTYTPEPLPENTAQPDDIDYNEPNFDDFGFDGGGGDFD